MTRDERHRSRPRFAAMGFGALLLLAGGGAAIGLAAASQDHAPQPTAQAAGSTGPARAVRGGRSTHGGTESAVGRSAAAPQSAQTVVGPTLASSTPVSITIPSIGVHSALLKLGTNTDGTIQVPPLGDTPATNEAAWFDGSPTPGSLGPSIIEGHIDSAYQGPSVFFRLGSLQPGDPVDVALADGTVAVFTVTGVREYPKASFPTAVVYGNTAFAALRLITCGGAFDYTTHHYLSNTVVFASLTSSHPESAPTPSSGPTAGGQEPSA